MNNKQFSMDINSCGLMVLDPQKELSAALAQSDILGFRLALDKGGNPDLQDDKHLSIYGKALMTHGCAEFVEECLKRGSNPNYVNQHLKKAAINFAADSCDPQIISALLRQTSVRVQVDAKYANLTPLNSLAKNLTAENANDVAASIRLLLNYGASPNIPDQREMTPLSYVLKNRKIDEHKKRELIKMFLEMSNDLDIDSFRDGEVRNLLRDQFPDMELPTQGSSAHNVSVDQLLNHIRSGDTKQFLQQFHKRGFSAPEEKARDIELLMESIRHCSHEAFDAIMQTDVDINQLQNGNSAIKLAAICGNWFALQKLLSHEHLELRRQDELLITVIKNFDELPTNEHCDRHKSLYVVLDSERVDVNETDPSGSTPLHYAVKYRNREAIQALLKRGAYIGMQSKFSDLPIDDMHPELLEEHFDSCLSTNGLKIGDQNFEIIMNYMNLMPRQPDHQEGKVIQHTPHDEMSPIVFIAESKEHRYLLQHPLITSFLFLKWHRLSIIFYINFLLYIFFAISIITHTILKFRESEYSYVTTLFGLFSWIGIAYLLLREITQFLMSPIIYIRSPTNYMEILLIGLSVITCIETNYDRETQRVVAVFTILLAALELCLLVGSLPVLSISTHMLMLRAVSTSFIKSFTLYSIFVITFSLCFYILFGKPELDDKGLPKTDENGQFNKFTNPFAAVIKTIVMLTGEFDAGDIDFDSLYSYFIFLLFVFFMSIVLFNLLNGLAVSDTQAIKAQAELNGSICRANVLARYEKVLNGRSGRTCFIFNHYPFRAISRNLMNLYPSYIAGRQIAITPNDNNRVMIPIANSYEMTTIFKSGTNAQSSKTTFLPVDIDSENELQKKALDPPVRALACCFPCMKGRCAEMDNRTVKSALAVLEQKIISQQERQRLQKSERRLENIEQKLEEMFKLLHEIQKMKHNK